MHCESCYAHKCNAVSGGSELCLLIRPGRPRPHAGSSPAISMNEISLDPKQDVAMVKALCNRYPSISMMIRPPPSNDSLICIINHWASTSLRYNIISYFFYFCVRNILYQRRESNSRPLLFEQKTRPLAGSYCSCLYDNDNKNNNIFIHFLIKTDVHSPAISFIFIFILILFLSLFIFILPSISNKSTARRPFRGCAESNCIARRCQMCRIHIKNAVRNGNVCSASFWRCWWSLRLVGEWPPTPLFFL